MPTDNEIAEVSGQLGELKWTALKAIREALELVPEQHTLDALWAALAAPQNQTQGFASEGDLLDGVDWIFGTLIENLYEEDDALDVVQPLQALKASQAGLL